MWTCPCGCRGIAADLPVCPMCSKEKIMPKATSGGASNAWEELEPGTQAPVAPAAEVAPTETAAPTEEPAPAAPEAPAPAVEAPDVSSMTKAQLQDHADSLGLPTDGTKADLAARITDHVETAAAEQAPAQTETAS